jgi:hypothetical protein
MSRDRPPLPYARMSRQLADLQPSTLREPQASCATTWRKLATMRPSDANSHTIHVIASILFGPFAMALYLFRYAKVVTRARLPLRSERWIIQ